MNRKTFELIAKWIAKMTKIGLRFVEDGMPTADVQRDIITIPTNISDANALAGLAVLMHEAGHLRITKEVDPELRKITQGHPIRHLIINAIEDTVVDKWVMSQLPNIRSFFDRLYEMNNPEVRKDRPFIKAFVQAIIEEEGFPYPQYATLKVKERMALDKLGFFRLFQQAVYNRRFHNWADLKRAVDALEKMWLIPPPPPQPGPGQGQGKGQGQGGKPQKQKKGKDEQEDGEGDELKEEKGTGDIKPSKRQDPEDEEGDEGEEEDEGKGDETKEPEPEQSEPDKPEPDKPEDEIVGGGGGMSAQEMADVIKDALHKRMWGTGQLEGSSSDVISPIAMRDQTRAHFKELLNKEEQRLVFDGNKLNTDDLTAFFTGDLEGLFVDDVKLKRKRSKVYFLLDGSGSMDERLFDGKQRRTVLANTVNTLTSTLDELIEQEGCNIQYEVHGFTYSLQKLDQENWVRHYMALDGGTSLYRALSWLLEHVSKDIEVDGEKMVVMVTDGDVSEPEIEECRLLIVNKDPKLRAMVLGIGADPGSRYVHNIIGDEKNILAEEMAEEALIHAITEMIL